ncbi:unnamed protein product, partial [Brenthis ino]
MLLNFFLVNSMKKLKHSHVSGKRIVKSSNVSSKEVSNNKPTKLESIDEDDQGFGGWLRSEEGMENMKLFVIANTIVLLTTMTYSHIQYFIGMISDALYGADGVL